ncbi:MAG: asparaginase [Gemmatimonadota bacterium]
MIALLLVVLATAATPLTAQAPLPRVVILTTGGTIASRSDAPMASGDSLVSAVPELLQHARVSVEEFSRVGSSQMTPAHWLALSQRVNALFAADAELAGIVVTHGTDTMDETAFFLNLTVRDARPVVVTGSMRSATEISADGPANLLNAVRVAASPSARGQGVLVVLNEDISAARDVWKTDNRRVDTFASPELGHLGYVDPDTVVFLRASLKPHTVESAFDVRASAALPSVLVAHDYTGFERRDLEDLIARRPDGIVLSTFAGGRTSPGAREGVRAAVAAGIPVVLASRVPGGRIVGDPAAPLGALLAPDLSPWKARILLMLALMHTHDAQGLREIFARY